MSQSASLEYYSTFKRASHKTYEGDFAYKSGVNRFGKFVPSLSCVTPYFELKGGCMQ